VKAWGAAIAKHRGLRRATVAVARKLSVIMHRRRERVDWREHLETLFAMKAAGKIGHTGITTSHGRRHELFERIMREYPLDFVQLTYNILDREPEERLLPLARDRGIAVWSIGHSARRRRSAGSTVWRCRAGRTRSAPRAGPSSF
jgi:aryl-alcohol dehydrogenase-like predicted oxidoreductase